MGGGGRRSKHWPPGAGDPRYATDLEVHTACALEGVSICMHIHGLTNKMTTAFYSYLGQLSLLT